MVIEFSRENLGKLQELFNLSYTIERGPDGVMRGTIAHNGTHTLVEGDKLHLVDGVLKVEGGH